MKINYLILSLLFIILINIESNSQNTDDEIIKETRVYLDTLDNFINKGDYYLAIQETEKIQYGLKLLYGLYLDKNLCPTQLNEYKLDLENRSNEMDGNNITLVREYAKKNNDSTLNKDCLITLIISNNDPVIDKIANIQAFTFNLIDNEEQKYKPVEIEGYKALLVFDKERKYSSIAVALSNKTIVKITMVGSEDFNQIIPITKLLDYNKIKELVF